MSAWRVCFESETAFVHGPKTEARRRLAVCGDLSPIWVKRREAWATSTVAANRLVDQLEGHNITVPLEDARQVEFDLTETEPANTPVAQGVLW